MGFPLLSSIMSMGLLPMLVINIVASMIMIPQALYRLAESMFRRVLLLVSGKAPTSAAPAPSTTSPAAHAAQYRNEDASLYAQQRHTGTLAISPYPFTPRHLHHHHHPHHHDLYEIDPFISDPSDSGHLLESIPRSLLPDSVVYDPNDFARRALVPDLDGCDCSVCLSEFEAGDEINILPRCNHVFHKGCLSRWLVDHEHTTCPLCRMSLFQEAEEINSGQYGRGPGDRELSEDLIFWFSSNFHGSIGFPSFWCHV